MILCSFLTVKILVMKKTAYERLKEKVTEKERERTRKFLDMVDKWEAEIQHKEETSAQKVIDYLWETEMDHFLENHDISSPYEKEDVSEWIRICEEKGYTDHIFYHLMVLSHAYDLRKQ
jgi:hypothetical protein